MGRAMVANSAMANCVLIGSGPGVGEAIARRFGAGGCRIGLIARSQDRLERQTDRLKKRGIRVYWATGNAGIGDELKSALSQLNERMGPCDVLIYNAAVVRPKNPLELAAEEMLAEISVNLLGAHLAAKIVAPAMVAKGGGTIIFTGGGLALEPFPEWTSLALGKAALRSLSFSLFKDLAPKGVHVCVIAICGIVKTGGLFDPDRIAQEYWRVATGPGGTEMREVLFQPVGSDPLYNDPERKHSATTIMPGYVLPGRNS